MMLLSIELSNSSESFSLGNVTITKFNRLHPQVIQVLLNNAAIFAYHQGGITRKMAY